MPGSLLLYDLLLRMSKVLIFLHDRQQMLSLAPAWLVANQWLAFNLVGGFEKTGTELLLLLSRLWISNCNRKWRFTGRQQCWWPWLWRSVRGQ